MCVVSSVVPGGKRADVGARRISIDWSSCKRLVQPISSSLEKLPMDVVLIATCSVRLVLPVPSS